MNKLLNFSLNIFFEFGCVCVLVFSDTYSVPAPILPSLSTLLGQEKLRNHLTTIEQLVQRTNTGEQKIDSSQEYPLIVTSNQFILDIDTEIASLHKFCRDVYSTKYAELEQVVQSPVEYARVVKIIGNEMDATTLEKKLQGIVPNNVILTISVTATTSAGKALTETEFLKLEAMCNLIIELDEAKKKVSAMCCVATTVTPFLICNVWIAVLLCCLRVFCCFFF